MEVETPHSKAIRLRVCYRPAIGMADIFRQRPALFDAQEYRFYNYIPNALANAIHDEINSFFNYYDAGGGSAPADNQT